MHYDLFEERLAEMLQRKYYIIAFQMETTAVTILVQGISKKLYEITVMI